MPRFNAPAVCVVVALALGGCSPVMTGSPSATPEVLATGASPTDPSPSATATISRTAISLRPGPLNVGEVRVTHFQPGFSFVLPEPGWSIEYVGASAIGLLRASSDDVDEFGLNVHRVDDFINAIDAQTGDFIDAPRDIAAWLQSHRYLDLVDGPEETSIDGLDAVQFDTIATQGPAEMAPGGGEPGMVPMLGGAGGCCLNLEPGAAYRWIFFDVEGVTMWVNVIAFEGAQFDDVVEEARPVIESMTFE